MPPGTATAQRSSRLTNVENIPRRALTPMGSAATAASVGTVGTDGSMIASTSTQTVDACGAKLPSPVLGPEQVGRAESSPPAMMALGHGVDLGCMGIEEAADGGVTFGEPGPLVQEVADVEERADGDLAQSHAQVGQLLALDLEHLDDLRIAALQDRVVGDPDDDVVRRRDRALPTVRDRTGVDVGGVGSGHRAQDEGRVAGGEGEHRDAVE